jgi:multidrug efflux pump subunit AcrA (membrane-fusion protein)
MNHIQTEKTMQNSRMLVVLGLAAALLAGCNPAGRGKAKVEERQAVAVTVVTADTGTVIRSTNLVGALVGEQQVTVMPKVMGRVTEIARPEGSFVKAGDPILYIVNDIPGMDYKPGPVLSPIDGVVGKVNVEVGQTAAPTMPVATVASYGDRIRVKAAVSDADLPYVKAGATADVTVSAVPDQVFSGRVTRISPMVDAASRSATVEITLGNSRRQLVPGMTASVRLVVERRERVVTVPLGALFATDRTRAVIVEGTTARTRTIQVGLVGDDKAEIVSGINPGDKVATTGKERVQDGETVRPIDAGAAPVQPAADSTRPEGGTK